MQSGKLFTGTGTHGNSNTGFFLGSDSKFSLGDKLVWDGSNLSVAGSITITGGSGFATPSDVATAAAGAGTASSAAQTAATNAANAAAAQAAAGAATASSAAQTAATNAGQAAANAAAAGAATASSAVQSNLNSVSSSVASDVSANASAAAAAQNAANSAHSSATNAINNAQTAQDAIDDMETQVVLDGTGMELRKANGKKVAKYGTTTRFFDGTDSENIKLELNTTGVKSFGATAAGVHD